VANTLYDKGREGFLDGSIDWDTNAIKAVVCDGTYTPNFATDDNLDDIPGGAQISHSPVFTGKTVAAGVADADDPLFTAVTAGKTLNRLVIYKDTGVAATSRLIGAIDTLAGGGAMSIPTSGGDLLFRFDNGANRIFKL
jgi:hypothetical protein